MLPVPVHKSWRTIDATLTPTGHTSHALALVPAYPSPGIPLVQHMPSVQQFLRHFPAVVGQLLHDFFVEPEIHRC
jgi:hypothetical protein